MADLKVKILADSNQAIQNVNNFNDVTKDTFKSLSKMQNELNKLEYYQNQIDNFKGSRTSEAYTKLEAALKKLKDAGLESSKVQEQFRYILEKTNNAFLTQGTGVQEYTKLLKNTDSWIQKLSASTRDSDFINSLYEYRTEIEKTVDALKEQEAEEQRKNALLEKQKRSIEEFNEVYKLSKSQNVDYLKATALGDKSFILKQQYSLLDSELTKLLTTEGKITPKTQELANKMVALEKEMRKASKTPINERMANLVKSFVSAQAVVWAVSKAFRTLTSVLKESAKAAAKAEETANLFNTTFETIQSTANKVSSSLSNSLGFSNSTIQQSLGLFGDLAIGYGQSQSAALSFAEAAVQTGLDIMSFKNISGDTTEILQTMASGLAGNFENFRKWGIIVTQAEIKTRLQQKGLDKLTGSSLQFAKVQETLAIVQEKSKNAQGDLQKTLESTENITRRVSEANKELLENIGQNVNPVLNTFRNMWLDIVTSINKAIKAEKEFAKGNYTTGVYDIKNNEDDAKAFERAVGSNAYGTWSFGTLTNILNIDNYAQTVSDAMIKFDASLLDTIDIVKKIVNISTSDLNTLIAKLQETENKRIAWTKEEKRIEKNRIFVTENASNAQSFIDNLNNILGVTTKNQKYKLPENYTNKSFYKNEAGVNNNKRFINLVLSESINDAINSLSSTTWKDFSNAIDVALGNADSTSALEEKLKSIYALYEDVYNLRYKDGKLTDDEKAELQKIADIYTKTKKEIEAITKLEEVRSKISSVADSNEELKISISEIGMSDLEKSIAAIQREIMQIAFSDLSAEEKATAKAMYEKRIQLLKEEDSAKKLYKAEQKYAKILNDISSKKSDLQTQIRQSGMSDREIALDELNQELASSLEGITNTDEIAKIKKDFDELISLTNKFYDLKDKEVKDAAQKDFETRLQEVNARTKYSLFSFDMSSGMQSGLDAYNDWYNSNDVSKLNFSDLETMKQQMISAYSSQYLDMFKQGQMTDIFETIKSSLGEIWDLFDSLNTLSKGGGAQGLLAIAVKLITQTELFNKTASFLSDTILPVLNAFLEPTVSLLSDLTSLTQNLLVKALDPLFALFKTANGIIIKTLTPIFEILSALVSDILSPLELILDTIAKTLELFTAIFTVGMQLLQPLFKIITLIFDLLKPLIDVVLKPIYNFLKFLVEWIIRIFTHVEVFIKKIIGTVAGFFLDAWNTVVGVLRSINILGWQPFGGLGYVDTSWANDFKNADANKLIAERLAQLNKTAEDIDDTSLKIESNTSKDNEESLRLLEQLYQDGVITGLQRDAQVAALVGRNYDATKLINGGAYRSTGYNTTINVGDIKITLEGGSYTKQQAEEIAQTVIKEIKKQGRAGSSIAFAS
ncbi:phage tail protein [Bullifex porci]|uniref:phage tail protein n=1 Tax=Bullifex porci TaxID=2606638 RepID=UPI0023F283A8|nr:hypothetical protein [Bullifex porci]MDD7256185.1 hypothetical protein [Bullifex porci]